MKKSRRALRMERHHERKRRLPAMNLVSLMDIFTILVFFLLVNSSNIEVLPSARALELPEARSEVLPRESVVVMVTSTQLIVQGEPVFSFADVSRAGEDALPALVGALRRNADVPAETEITVMADQSIPFRLLKRVMASCTEAGFENISLAVLQRLPGGDSP